MCKDSIRPYFSYIFKIHLFSKQFCLNKSCDYLSIFFKQKNLNKLKIPNNMFVYHVLSRMKQFYDNVLIFIFTNSYYKYF